MVLGLRIDKLYLYLLTSGTGYHWSAKECQPIALDVGDYKGQ
jgi:hypothetical protein